MGAQKLILIAPECEIDLQARQGAAGAQTHLMESTKYDTWEDFFKNEDEGVIIAFCARGKKDMDALPIAERMQDIKNKVAGSVTPLYFVFGPEDHGLENEDLEYANFICTLPVYGNFKSYNLSHATLLALFIANQTLFSTQPAEPMASEKFYFPSEAIQMWLSKLGFSFGERRTDVYKVIKRILLRNLASQKELRILEAVVNQTIRKLPNQDSASD